MYAPTSKAEEEEVEQFYEDLDKAMKCLKSQDIKIVMGDFNAKVGSERVENIVGPWGIGEENERGERLIEWCKEKKSDQEIKEQFSIDIKNKFALLDSITEAETI